MNVNTSNKAIDGPEGISNMYANKIPKTDAIIPDNCVAMRVDLKDLPI